MVSGLLSDDSFKQVRYLVFSDVHLGNARNPTWRILENLRDYFCQFKQDSFEDKFGKLDLIFIGGDFFDKGLLFSSDEIVSITSFVCDLFLFCEQQRIRLRYLKGTDSHERNQFKNFVPVALRFKYLDFRYVEDMEVEFFNDLGISCLYVPDEHAGGGEKSQNLIEEKFKELQIEKVSIAMVHSWFKYQVPEVASTSKYDEKFFLDRVEYYISNGHIHAPSTFDRLVTQGSFDRIAHNEEHKKGAFVFDISPYNQLFFFVENKNALPFITVTLKDQKNDKHIDKELASIEKLASSLPEYSWIRLRGKESHPLLSSLTVLNSKYPHVRFEKITIEEEERVNQQLVNQKDFEDINYEAPRLDRDNIVSVLVEEIKVRRQGKINYDPHFLRNHLERLR